MKGLLRCLSVLLCVVAAGSLAGEVVDNAKLESMLKEKVPMDIILTYIKDNLADCRFDASAEALIKLQKAAEAGALAADKVTVILKRVQEVANLDRKRQESIVSKLANVLENGDPLEISAIMRETAKEGKPLVPYILRRLEEESDRKRAGMLDALALIKDKSPHVLNAAMLMLTDRSKPVRAQAAVCVSELAGVTTCEELVARVNSRTEQFLDGYAMALGFVGDRKAISPLTQVLKISANADARIAAAFALGKLRANTPESTSALLEAVLDDHEELLRDAAAKSLALIREGKTPAYIIQAFHRYPKGKENIISHLRYFKDLRAAEFLVEEVDNDNPKIKASARETLQAMTGESFDSKDEWSAWLDRNRARPDWVKPTSGTRVPDARPKE